jgi:hypothetical protein
MSKENEQVTEKTAEETAALQEAEAAKVEAEKLEAEKAEAAKKLEEHQTETPEGDVFEITDVERTADGKLVWKADPTDPEGSVYTGKDLNELLKNISDGVKAKDSYIKKLKTESTIKPEVAKGRKPDTEKETVDNVPQFSEVLISTAKKYGVAPEMLQWTDEEWKNREIEKGSVATNREARMVESVLAEANKVHDQLNVDFINDSTLEQETEQVRKLVAKYKLEDQFGEKEYGDVLDKVYAEKDNFNRKGVRKNGAIIAEVVNVLDELRTKSITKKIGDEKDESLAANRKLKAKLAAPAKSKTDPIPKSKAPSSIAEAANEIMAGWKDE